MDKKITIAIVAVAVVVIAVAACFAAGVFDNNKKSGPGSLGGNTIDEDHFPDSDSRLWVYGNANEDDKIDSSDLTYIQNIIDRTKTATTLADANADGRVDADDIAYAQSIIDEDEIDVYYIDNYFKVAEVSWPVNSIAIGYCSGAYLADLAGVCDKVDMIDETITSYWTEINSNFSKAASFGSTGSPDYEAMMNNKIDVYVVGYCDANADVISPGKLNPAGIDVMFITTCDNDGVDYPNEYIDRSTFMFGFLLQGDMDKMYDYLEWHDDVLDTLIKAGETIADDDKAAFMMARSSPFYSTSTISITGKDNTNNIHAEWVGVDAVGQHSSYLPSNYNKLTAEQILTVILESANDNVIYYMDNEHDGLRHQYNLDDCIAADKKMLESSDVEIHYLGMAREAGNSPLYVIELTFYQNVMYPGLTDLDYTELFDYYFSHFTSEDYSSLIDIDDYFKDYGTA